MNTEPIERWNELGNTTRMCIAENAYESGHGLDLTEMRKILVQSFLEVESQTEDRLREKIKEEIRKLKGWVFTAPYGLEVDSFTGEVIPRKRSDDTYLKVKEILSLPSLNINSDNEEK